MKTATNTRKNRGELGTSGDRLAEARTRLDSLLARHAQGEHVWAWTGEVADIEGGSLHRVLGCMICPARRVGEKA
jgi:hypothetical protein